MTDTPSHHPNLDKFIAGIPKAELHIHVGGTLEPELLFKFAARNNRPFPYDSIDALRAAYNFSNLQEFLDLFHMGTQVMMQEADYYELTWEYISRIHAENVRHTEVFFDAQTHTDRGIPFSVVIHGIHRALSDARERYGISSCLIPSFLRHLGPEAAMNTFREALEFRELIAGFGLASSELGHPPEDYRKVYDAVRSEGFRVLAHAGEEGPPEYIWQALDILHVDRIDHGNRAMEDEALLEELAGRQVPLTLCPLSNLKLCVIRDMKDHPVKRMLDRGLMVTVNSDDPAYFGGYMNANFSAVAQALQLDKEDITRLAVNSFEASFLPADRKEALIRSVRDYARSN